MKTPEAKEKDKLKAYLDSIGCFHFAPVTWGYGKSGIPDRVACINSIFIGMEVKSPWGKLTVWQKRCLNEIENAGGIALSGTADEIISKLAPIAAKHCPTRFLTV